jgi:hypothetical protein
VVGANPNPNPKPNAQSDGSAQEAKGRRVSRGSHAADGHGGVRLRLCAPSHSARALGPVRAFTFGVRVRAHRVNHRLDPTRPLHTPMGTLGTHASIPPARCTPPWVLWVLTPRSHRPAAHPHGYSGYSRLDPTGPLHTPMGYSQRGTLGTHSGVLWVLTTACSKAWHGAA